MKKWWFKRIGIIVLVSMMTMGTGYGVEQIEAAERNRQVNGIGNSAEYVIPGGMTIGIYMETDGVLVLSTDCIKCIDGNEYEPAKNLVKAGDYIVGINGDKIENKNELVKAVNRLESAEVILSLRRDKEYIDVRMQSARFSSLSFLYTNNICMIYRTLRDIQKFICLRIMNSVS